jgi:hypothetical protein
MNMVLYAPDEETTSRKSAKTFDSHSVWKYKHPQPSISEFISQKVDLKHAFEAYRRSDHSIVPDLHFSTHRLCQVRTLMQILLIGCEREAIFRMRLTVQFR